MDGFVTIGNLTMAAETALAAAVALVFAGLFLVAVIGWRRASLRAETYAARARDIAQRAEETEQKAQEAERIRGEDMQRRLAELAQAQGTINGQMRSMTERLEGFGQRVGQSMTENASKTHEGLSKLGERLAVIDQAQKNITSLSSQVVELQQILANKQTRGAYGQARMEAIIRDGLPASGYVFQPTLKNNTRPDCLVLFPNGTPSLVVDAKFPLEAWNLIREAATPEAVKVAEAQFRRDMTKHITDIAARYFIPGETQDTAFMFVPSESIFADIHERFEDIIQKAHRARVVIVSPSLLMLSIQVVMSLLRDARMREQAHVIQEEVLKLLEDVDRLDQRVRKLQTHFVQAGKDIDDIQISSRKVTSRGQKIMAVEIEDGEAEPPQVRAPRPTPKRRDNLPELPFNQVEEV